MGYHQQSISLLLVPHIQILVQGDSRFSETLSTVIIASDDVYSKCNGRYRYAHRYVRPSEELELTGSGRWSKKWLYRWATRLDSKKGEMVLGPVVLLGGTAAAV